MRSRAILSALLVFLPVAILPFRAAETAASPENELVRQEKVRQEVAAIFADLHAPPERQPDQAPLFTWITERLIALGPEIEPLMIAELESPNRFTFNIAAYVLGMLHTPHAKEAILKAAEIAERDGHAFGRDRKVWLGYALAVTGDPDALDVLDTGKVNAVHKELFEGLSVLEIVAILTAPGCGPKLLEKLDRYAKSDEPVLKERQQFVLRAIGRAGDPSMRDRLVPYLDSVDFVARDAAARALANLGDPSVADRLLSALEDKNDISRFGVAAAIEQLKPSGKTRAIVARLEGEQNSAVRGALYRTLAVTGGEAAFDSLAGYWGRPDALDRVFLVDALAVTRNRKALNLLRTALQDPDNRVALHAVGALAGIGGPAAMDTLLGTIRDPRWPVEEETIHVLAGMGEARAASRIADRVRSSLLAPVTDPAEREQITIRAESLVDLRYTPILPDLRKGIESQPDPTLVDSLRSIARRLAAMEERKDDVSRWIEALASPDLEIRKVAYRRLGELKAQSAVKPLVEAFGRVEVAEGAEILRSLGTIGSVDAATLLERLLLDPAFDLEERQSLRSMAAWAARRVGGARMVDVLKRAAERRDGRDINVLVYLAVLSGKDAIGVLESLRASRLRWFDWRRGPELDRLDFILRELKASRPIDGLDKPPDAIALS